MRFIPGVRGATSGRLTIGAHLRYLVIDAATTRRYHIAITGFSTGQECNLDAISADDNTCGKLAPEEIYGRTTRQPGTDQVERKLTLTLIRNPVIIHVCSNALSKIALVDDSVQIAIRGGVQQFHIVRNAVVVAIVISCTPVIIWIVRPTRAILAAVEVRIRANERVVDIAIGKIADTIAVGIQPICSHIIDSAAAIVTAVKVNIATHQVVERGSIEEVRDTIIVVVRVP